MTSPRVKAAAVGGAVLAVAATIGVVAGTRDSPAPTPDAFIAPNIAAWSVKCNYARQTAPVDPIVAYGVTPTAHTHQFFGEAGITQTTKPADLRASTAQNFCTPSVDDPANPGTMLPDRAAYWTPAVYTTPAKTTQLTRSFMIVYYRNAGRDPKLVQPPPQDLAMVGGNGKATTPQQLGVASWQCISGQDKGPLTPTIPASCPLVGATDPTLPYQLRGNVSFPDCLSPTAAAPNWTTGMVYAAPNPDTSSKWARICPAGYTPVPQVQIEFRWTLAGTPVPIVGGAYDLTGITIASDGIAQPDGTVTGSHGTTLHADDMSGWLQADLDKLVLWCYHGGPDGTLRPHNCGQFGRNGG